MWMNSSPRFASASKRQDAKQAKFAKSFGRAKTPSRPSSPRVWTRQDAKQAKFAKSLDAPRRQVPQSSQSFNHGVNLANLAWLPPWRFQNGHGRTQETLLP